MIHGKSALSFDGIFADIVNSPVGDLRHTLLQKCLNRRWLLSLDRQDLSIDR